MFLFNRFLRKERVIQRNKWRAIAAGASTLIGGLWTMYSILRRGSKNRRDSVDFIAFDEPDLNALTKEALYEQAQEREIEGRSTMSKDELIDALKKE